jgi:hypothetical protein
MSIRQQVEDARFLAQHGRFVGALTLLLLAAAGSSRKLFPERTRGDKEPFTLFLGGRIARLVSGDPNLPECGESGIEIGFRGKQYDIADILYHFYRCTLVHESALPADVEFAPTPTSYQVGMVVGQNIAFGISTQNTLVLDHGWLDLLAAVVVGARCNGSEFGITHYSLLPKPGIDEKAFIESTITQHGISLGRFHLLKGAVCKISPEIVVASQDDEMKTLFSRLVRSGHINGGGIAGLSSRGLADGAGLLQPKGLAVMREIAAAYERVAA